eukprot:g56194.t1
MSNTSRVENNTTWRGAWVQAEYRRSARRVVQFRPVPSHDGGQSWMTLYSQGPDGWSRSASGFDLTSQYGLHDVKLAFNGLAATAGHYWSSGQAYLATGLVNQSAAAQTPKVDGNTTVWGEWVQLAHSSTARRVRSLFLTTRLTYFSEAPRRFRLLGSQDGVSWTTVYHADPVPTTPAWGAVLQPPPAFLQGFSLPTLTPFLQRPITHLWPLPASPDAHSKTPSRNTPVGIPLGTFLIPQSPGGKPAGNQVRVEAVVSFESAPSGRIDRRRATALESQREGRGDITKVGTAHSI